MEKAILKGNEYIGFFQAWKRQSDCGCYRFEGAGQVYKKTKDEYCSAFMVQTRTFNQTEDAYNLERALVDFNGKKQELSEETYRIVIDEAMKKLLFLVGCSGHPLEESPIPIIQPVKLDLVKLLDERKFLELTDPQAEECRRQ